MKHPDVLCVIAGKVWHNDFSRYKKLIDELGLKDYTDRYKIYSR